MMGEEILKESTYVQALIEKWEPVILARKEAEGMRKMTQIALEGRFGTLSGDLLAALEAASPETLEDIAAHISTDTLEQIRARLGLE